MHHQLTTTRHAPPRPATPPRPRTSLTRPPHASPPPPIRHVRYTARARPSTGRSLSSLHGAPSSSRATTCASLVRTSSVAPSRTATASSMTKRSLARSKPPRKHTAPRRQTSPTPPPQRASPTRHLSAPRPPSLTFAHLLSGRYSPLKHIDPTQAQFNACNSSLSEFAVLGFELGYSLENPASLVMWEVSARWASRTAIWTRDHPICAKAAPRPAHLSKRPTLRESRNAPC